MYILIDGTVVEHMPAPSYAADGSLLKVAQELVARGFIGGGTYTVSAAEATILTNAGYTVDA